MSKQKNELDADVLLLAAGLGTRLQPLTFDKPKPLIEVGGKTLISRNLELISRSRANRVFINLHYLGEQIRAVVGDGSAWGLNVCYSEEPKLLDTGGAVKNIEAQLEHRELVVINSDILLGPDFSLEQVLLAHRLSTLDPECTMVLRADINPAKYGTIGVAPNGRVVSFLGVDYGPEAAAEELIYLGVMVLDRSMLTHMPARGEVFSLTRDTICRALERGVVIDHYRYEGYWSDVGTIDRLKAASKACKCIFGVPAEWC